MEDFHQYSSIHSISSQTMAKVPRQWWNVCRGGCRAVCRLSPPWGPNLSPCLCCVRTPRSYRSSLLSTLIISNRPSLTPLSVLTRTFYLDGRVSRVSRVGRYCYVNVSCPVQSSLTSCSYSSVALVALSDEIALPVTCPRVRPFLKAYVE